MQTNQSLNSLTKLTASFLLGLIMTGCGFQLRWIENNQLNQSQISIVHPITLDNDLTYIHFERFLKRDLNSLGSNIIESGQMINYANRAIQLGVFKLTFTSQGISRDATGRANEQEITARLDYQLSQPEAESAISKDNLQTNSEMAILSLTATASYFQDYHNPSAGEVQKRKTQTLLLQQLSQKLIHQLQLQLSQSQLNQSATN